jgi:hypothetical protein
VLEVLVGSNTPSTIVGRVRLSSGISSPGHVFLQVCHNYGGGFVWTRLPTKEELNKCLTDRYVFVSIKVEFEFAKVSKWEDFGSCE